MRILVLVFLCLCTQTAISADYPLKVWSFDGRLASEAVDKTLTLAQQILNIADGSEDIACPTKFNRTASVVDGSSDQLPTSINSKKDWQRFIADARFSIYEVASINWCGGPAVGGVFAGCARQTGPVAIARGKFTPVVVAHEIGHGQGNLHNPAKQHLMNPYALAANTMVNDEECGNFELGMLIPIMDPQAPDIFTHIDDPFAPMAAIEGEPPPPPTLAELLQMAWHKPPVEDIAALSSDDIDEVRLLLAGDPTTEWPNAVTILGLRGQTFDRYLLAEIGSLAGSMVSIDPTLPWPSVITNAGVALGMIYNRTNDARTLQAINDAQNWPGGEFSKQAAMLGLAYGGAAVTENHPDALDTVLAGWKFENNTTLDILSQSSLSCSKGIDGATVCSDDPGTLGAMLPVLEEEARMKDEAADSFAGFAAEIQTEISVNGLGQWLE